MINKRRGLALVLFTMLIVILTITGCGKKQESQATQQSQSVVNKGVEQKSQNSSVDLSGQSDNNNQKSIETQTTSIQQNQANMSERKIIKSAAIQMETLQFDDTVNALINKTKNVGGYIESSTIQGKRIQDKDTLQNRTARLVIRVPKQLFEQFILDVGNFGNVINKSTSGEDVTAQYFDTEAHLKSLRIHEERLLEILKKTVQLKDIVELERELANVRYQIESLTGTLRKWDNMIDYSTLNIEIYEVQEIKEAKQKPISMWGQMSHGFTKSVSSIVEGVKQLIISIAYLIPYIIVIFVIGYIIYLISQHKSNQIKNIISRKKNGEKKSVEEKSQDDSK
jgi:hypothetical protein